MSDRTERRSEIQSELRAPLLVLLMLIPLLAFAGWQLDASIVGAQTQQREIRRAQILRSRVLRFQVDEETGLRGYEATGDRLFLEPFEKAKRPLDESITALEIAAGRLGLRDLVTTVEQQRTLNAVWIQSVATRALAGRRGFAAYRLELRGKHLIDTFRNRDQQIASALNGAADDADARSDRSLKRLALYIGVVSGAIVLGASVFGYFRARSARERFEGRLLLDNQKRIAEALQTAFINKTLPRLAAVSLRGTYVPAEKEAQIGGDWYDAFQFPDGRILFSIGDVAGHGLEAAVVMSRARQAIIAAAIGEFDPAKVLERANQAILLQESKMVTAICGFIDPQTFEVTYSTAGHPAPILVRPGSGAHYLPQSGIPLGIFKHTNYRTYVANASVGAVIFLYTDGLIEHERDIVRGEKKLLQASLEAGLDPDDPARELHRLVLGERSAQDDVAILAIGFRDDGATEPNVVTVAHLIEHPSASREKRATSFTQRSLALGYE